MRIISALLGITFLAVACIPDERPSLENFQGFGINGEWEAPIANITLTLDDLTADVPLLTGVPDQPMSIFFRQDDAFSLTLSDFVTIEDQEILNRSFSLGTSFVSFNTEIGSSLGIELYQMNLQSGFLNWECSSSETDTLIFELQFLNGQQNGQPVVWQIQSIGGTGSGQITLEDLNFDLLTGPSPHSNLSIRLDHLNAVPAHQGENFTIELNIESFTPGYVEGFFGNRQVDLPETDFTVDYGGLNNIVDGIFFTNPQMRLFINNQVGLPAEINTDIIGANSSNLSTNLGLPPLQLLAPTTIGDSAITTYTIDPSNSQIVDFLRILPNQFSFSGAVEINPLSAPSQTNFVRFDSKLSGDLELELPLSFGAEDIVYQQDITDIDFGISNDTLVERIDLRFLTKNSLPLGVNLEMIWYDENSVAVDSVSLPLLKAPSVDNSGRSIGFEEDEVTISFSDQRLDTFLKTDLITIRGTLETSNGGAPVSLYPDNGLEIKLGSRIKFKEN